MLARHHSIATPSLHHFLCQQPWRESLHQAANITGDATAAKLEDLIAIPDRHPLRLFEYFLLGHSQQSSEPSSHLGHSSTHLSDLQRIINAPFNEMLMFAERRPTEYRIFCNAVDKLFLQLTVQAIRLSIDPSGLTQLQNRITPMEANPDQLDSTQARKLLPHTNLLVIDGLRMLFTLCKLIQHTFNQVAEPANTGIRSLLTHALQELCFQASKDICNPGLYQAICNAYQTVDFICHGQDTKALCRHLVKQTLQHLTLNLFRTGGNSDDPNIQLWFAIRGTHRTINEMHYVNGMIASLPDSLGLPVEKTHDPYQVNLSERDKDIIAFYTLQIAQEIDRGALHPANIAEQIADRLMDDLQHLLTDNPTEADRLQAIHAHIETLSHQTGPLSSHLMFTLDDQDKIQLKADHTGLILSILNHLFNSGLIANQSEKFAEITASPESDNAVKTSLWRWGPLMWKETCQQRVPAAPPHRAQQDIGSSSIPLQDPPDISRLSDLHPVTELMHAFPLTPYTNEQLGKRQATQLLKAATLLLQMQTNKKLQLEKDFAEKTLIPAAAAAIDRLGGYISPADLQNYLAELLHDSHHGLFVHACDWGYLNMDMTIPLSNFGQRSESLLLTALRLGGGCSIQWLCAHGANVSQTGHLSTWMAPPRQLKKALKAHAKRIANASNHTSSGSSQTIPDIDALFTVWKDVYDKQAWRYVNVKDDNTNRSNLRRYCLEMTQGLLRYVQCSNHHPFAFHHSPNEGREDQLHR